MPTPDTDMTALRIEADVRLRAGQITETQARGIVRAGKVDPPAATRKGAKLYHDSAWPAIHAAMTKHLAGAA